MTSVITLAVRAGGLSRAGHALLLAAGLLGLQLLPGSARAQVPDASGPECVPVPGMPCPGDARPSRSSGSSRSSSSSGSRSSAPSTNTMMLQELQRSLDQMTTPNPAALQRIRQTRAEGDAALQEDVTSQQATEEQRRQKAQRAAEAARLKQLRDLAGSLQGLPSGGSPGGPALRPGGTPFFGQGGTGTLVPSSTDIEALRKAGSSGFDTRGALAGSPVAAPPPVSDPTPVELRDKPIPPERLTPQLQTLVKEREALRAQKKQMQSSLERFESKGRLTPEESAAMTKLRQDLELTLNKENYLSFTINESLP